jgi:hypothetical protein
VAAPHVLASSQRSAQSAAPELGVWQSLVSVQQSIPHALTVSQHIVATHF